MDRRRLVLVTLLCGLGYMMYSVDRMVMSSSVGLIAKDFHLSKGLSGLLMSSFFYGFVVLLFIGGILSDKFTGKTVLIWGLCIFSLATGATGLAAGFTTMLVYRIVTGLGEGLFWPAASQEITLVTTPEQRTTVMSIYWSGYPIGGFFGTWLGAVIGSHYGWRPVFLVAMLLGLVVALLYGLLVRHPKAADAKVSLVDDVPLREIFRKPTVVAFGVFYLLLMSGWWIVLLWAPTFMMTTKHMSLSVGGTIASLMGLSGALGGVLIGRYCDRGTIQRRKQVLVAITIITAILMALMVAPVPVWLLVLLVLLLGFFGYPITPVILTLTSQVVPKQVAGSAIGFVMNVGMLAGAITPALAGYLQENMAMTTVWVLAALVQLISCAALWFTGRLEGAQARDGAAKAGAPVS
ncbi:MAG: MFS transporter [Alicyclobacillus macrosporangiidus]|uniref:MFS transporter n=1 Tax=Alicyclobacillus macrosporangiidus TaxID=392015 RepID=UPI0026E93207|nr:MFS transporter [Alicyclobacillus macrosporangiidus]MCL6598583.1 MFS transporter [Alicyclobacillus macrosporangiidus]